VHALRVQFVGSTCSEIQAAFCEHAVLLLPLMVVCFCVNSTVGVFETIAVPITLYDYQWYESEGLLLLFHATESLGC
jgi:hypothetical protein